MRRMAVQSPKIVDRGGVADERSLGRGHRIHGDLIRSSNHRTESGLGSDLSKKDS